MANERSFIKPIIAIAFASVCIMAYLGYRDLFQESAFEKTYFPEWRFSRLVDNCALNMDNECNRVGMAYEAGHGTPRDFPKALEAYSKACELRNHYACSNAGRFLVRGAEGIEADPPKGVSFLETGCLKAGHAPGCLLLAKVRGHSQDPALYNPDKAYEAWVKACGLGNDVACAIRNTFILQTRHKKPANSTELNRKALESFEKLCEQTLTGGIGCLYYFERLYRKGKKPKQAGRIAERLSLGEQESGDQALSDATVMRYGLGKERDVTKTNPLLEKGCEEEDGSYGVPVWSCYLRGLNAIEANDETTAKKYLQKTCDLERFLGCEELKTLSLTRRVEEEAPPSPAENR